MNTEQYIQEWKLKMLKIYEHLKFYINNDVSLLIIDYLDYSKIDNITVIVNSPSGSGSQQSGSFLSTESIGDVVSSFSNLKSSITKSMNIHLIEPCEKIIPGVDCSLELPLFIIYYDYYNVKTSFDLDWYLEPNYTQENNNNDDHDHNHKYHPSFIISIEISKWIDIEKVLREDQYQYWKQFDKEMKSSNEECLKCSTWPKNINRFENSFEKLYAKYFEAGKKLSKKVEIMNIECAWFITPP